MHVLRRLSLCALTALVAAGCAQPTATPTLSPRQMTAVVLTVVAANVQQTLSAHATQSALTPIVAIPTSPPTLAVSGPSPTEIVPLTLTATPTPTGTPTPTPLPLSTTAAPPAGLASTPDLVAGASQPATVALSSHFAFEIERAEALTEAGLFKPRYGRFLVLRGSFVNQTGERPCVYSRYFRLGYAGERYAPATEAMSVAKNYYWVDFPGPINGQCIAPNSRAATFILFDAPEAMTTFDFIYRDVNVGVLTLVPRADGAFDVQAAAP